MEELIDKIHSIFPLCRQAIHDDDAGARRAAAAKIAWRLRDTIREVSEILEWAWEAGIQQCEQCGSWQGEKCCEECSQHLAPCSRCCGTGVDPTAQDPSGPWTIECRSCGGLGS